MVKIIGKDESVYKRVTCRNCATVLEYTPSDETQDYTSDYTGCKDHYSYIRCACCGEQVTTKNY